MACHFHGSVFCHLPARQLLPMGVLSPRRRRCSIALQKAFRVLAAIFFYGLFLWLAVQSDPHPAPLFAHFFWQDRKSGSPKAQLQCNCQNGSPVKPDKRADRDIRPYRVRRKITGGAGGGLAAFNGTSGANRPKRSGQCPLLFTPPLSRGPAAAPAAAQTRRPPPKAQTARRDGWQSPACCGSHSRAPRGRRPEARRA